MHRDTVLKMARAKVKSDFNSVTEAAAHMNIDRATLSLFLSDHKRFQGKEVPRFILSFLGLEASITITYKKVRGPNE